MKTTISNLTCVTPEQKWLKLWSVNWARGTAKGIWTFVSRKKVPMIESGIIQPDAVVIVPLHVEQTPTKRITTLIVTKEYRIPLGGYYYGFPAGLIDKDETPEQAATREIKEETGYDVVEVTKVSPPLFSSAGMTDESVVFVYVTVSGQCSAEGCEEAEDIEVLHLTDTELVDLYYKRGKFENALISAKLWPFLDKFLYYYGEL